MPIMEDSSKVCVWPWNSGGINTKIGSLKMLIMDTDSLPDVLAVQESGLKCAIPGYIRYRIMGQTEGKLVHTFVRRDLPVKQHDIELNAQAKSVTVEIMPKRKKQKSLIICNVYSNPKDTSYAVSQIFKKIWHVAKENPALTLGDFNAPHMYGATKEILRKESKLHTRQKPTKPCS